ncbi:MAG: formylglycine-generating enzyme family protein [Muribaculaceae bacterium]|nr:formylglycine-generating enzyme family protein [Muribaculaceae bacterium]
MEEDDAAEATETAGTVDADVESDMEEDSSEELSDSQLEIFHPVWSDDVTDDQRRVIQGILCNMVKVEGGQLELGATKEQLKWAKKKEMPAHMVELSPFWICKFPVTQGEWEAVIDGNDYLYKGSKIPQSKVSLVDCRKFVEQLRKLTGIAFALPTEAQWEFAARGGIHSKGFVYAGSDDLKEVGWCYSSCLGSPRNVGLLKPNELGLYDMSGNVFEWCDEMYGEYTSEYVKDPHNVYTKVGFWSSNHFVLRGGGAVSSKKACRISYRGEHMSADYQGLDYGLRLVVSTTSESETVSPEHNEAESLDVSGIVPNELESSAIPENESVSSDYNESDSSEDSVAVTAELELYEASFSESVSPERSEADSSEDSVIVPNESESTSASVGEAVSHASESEKFHPIWSEEVTEDQRRVILGILSNMVKVEGGQLELGATKEQLKWAKKKEMPAHMVELSSFWICKFPVTEGEWKTVINGNDSLSKRSKIPKNNLTLLACRKFVKRLRQLTGIDFTLPTEAQWEFAARGGIHSKGFVYAGSDNLLEVGWCYNSFKSGRQEVGLLKPNELGLYDMSGNVFEWCDEIFGEYTPDFVKDPHNHYTKSGFWNSGHYVLRGGDNLSNKKCRVSYREVTHADTYATRTYGLRLVINSVIPQKNV